MNTSPTVTDADREWARHILDSPQHNWSTPRSYCVESFALERARIREEATMVERERAAKCVPTNWTDNLLTGPRGIGSPPYDCRYIEKLLRGIQDAIRTSPGTGGEQG